MGYDIMQNFVAEETIAKLSNGFLYLNLRFPLH